MSRLTFKFLEIINMQDGDGTGAQKFERAVNGKLEDGWQLWGDPIALPETREMLGSFCQAFVKDTEARPEQTFLDKVEALARDMNEDSLFHTEPPHYGQMRNQLLQAVIDALAEMGRPMPKPR